eukprot:5059189-Heterocapsa_arctica.AAC.1
MGEAQAVEHLLQAKKTRVIIRDLQDELIRRTEPGTATVTGPDEAEKKVGDKKEAKDHRKREEEEASDISENAAKDIKKAGKRARSSDRKKEELEEGKE